MRQANFVVYFVSSLDFRSAADVGFTTPNVIPKDPLVLGIQSRNLLGIQDVVGDMKYTKLERHKFDRIHSRPSARPNYAHVI